jgi:pimeloyl-ACP methyl ester carboxylesterase
MEHAESTGISRRHLLAMAGVSAGAALLAQPTLFADSAGNAPAAKATASTKNPSFTSLKQIDAGLLNVGYAEAGPANGRAVILLHGWPYDIYSFIDVAPLLAAAGYRVIVPYLRGYGTTRFLSSETFRNAQPAVTALDTIALMDALKIDKAILAGFDWGGRIADDIAVLWPARCKALVSVSGYLIGGQAANKAPLPPKAELQWWYQFYFSTERGRDGYDKYRRDFAKLIWQIASPKWNFDDATFDRTAACRNMMIWKNGLPKPRRSPYPPLPWKGTPTGRHMRIPARTPRNSRASTCTEPLPEASGTICRRRLRRHLPRLSSMSTASNPLR